VPRRNGIQEDDVCGAYTTRQGEEKLLLNFSRESIKERNLAVHVRIILNKCVPLLKYHVMKTDGGVEV
jgi:hypothetical protein